MSTLASWLPIIEDVDDTRRQLMLWVKERLAARPREMRYIYLFLTRKCNLGCQHCYITGVGPQAHDADFDFNTIESLIEQARPQGLRRVKVSGGEPIVHKDFWRILEYLGSINLEEVVLETNGTLLRTADFFDAFTRIQNLTISVSLDHFDEHAHDIQRGRKGAYTRTAEFLRVLGRSNIRSMVTTVASRYNLRSITQIVDLVLRWGIDRHRTLLNIHPLGNAVNHPENAITLDECEFLIGEVLKHDAFRAKQAFLTLPPALLPLQYLTDVQSCGWGDSVLGILSNGSVSMCSASYETPELIAGNVYEDSLENIWENSALFDELRAIRSGNVNGVCGNCVFYQLCHGMCKMSSYAHYGDKNAPYPLCQDIYNKGQFPAYALFDSSRDCSYKSSLINSSRA